MVIYLTTNLVNGKKYLGKDTKNLPSYLGSGIFLKQAIEKYGKNNFKKEIIEHCNDENHLKEREEYLLIVIFDLVIINYQMKTILMC